MAQNPPKRILLFLDGTANSAAYGRPEDLTNIFRLNLAIHYDGNQIVHYMPGVGTRGDIISWATARGMDEILKEAYINLASNHQPGDNIYIFGYSRGGAVALALCDMISRVGLLWADNLSDFNQVWEIYIGYRNGRILTETEKRNIWQYRLEGRFHVDRDPVVRFLGLFDPVTGNRWDRRMRYSRIRFADPGLPLSVGAATNIISIDDNRLPSFEPTVLSGRLNEGQSLDQIWMPGVHADIGGNSDFCFLSDVSLLTMIEKARAHCPEIIWDENYVERIKANLGERTRVAISNERPDLARKILGRGLRKIITGPNVQESWDFSRQSLHPVYELILGREIFVKKRMLNYAPRNVPEGMPQFHSSDQELFKSATEKALSFSG